ncbi:hypothetical protein H310_00397 [Aphanomyces invadans]|uniref:SWIM-type domain-containing protein n=1 Tax=Aphanomyces invadans TaxID=157072 RepID=A0A024UTZ3_9STRA|nr:hypothetical protein H310_00397 [Aphanomyces invadans]ETW09986.1 hypothetical protein H310_00397 [Aphanomyces invadans]|eukprot:XP_008861397.1 hypothetical protein H310_00397 [Aphanomyces invadans]
MSTALQGNVVAITGKLSIGTRDMIADLVRAHGGVMARSMSKHVTHLVTSDPTASSTKLVQAKKLGVFVVGESFLTSLPPLMSSDASSPPSKKPKVSEFHGHVYFIYGDLSIDHDEVVAFIQAKGGVFSPTLTDAVTHGVFEDLSANSPAHTLARERRISMVDESYITRRMHADMFGSDTEDKAFSPVPKTVMADGDAVAVSGNSSNYEVRFRGGVYYCTCMGWKMQNKAVDVRSCKHLRQVLGDEFDRWRTKEDAKRGGAARKITIQPKQNAPKLLLAQKWQGQDVVGWWISEKFDGVRGYWTGADFVSRVGNVFGAPDFFKQNLPTNHHLDGELFLGRRMFEQTVGIVKSHNASDKWKRLKFMVFDIPTLQGHDFEARQAFVKSLVADCPYVEVVTQTRCTSEAMMLKTLADVQALGAEGLMLRQPRSHYVGSRSSSLLKVKTFLDDEAIVVGYENGKGKYAGVVGSLKVRNRANKAFSVGAGMTDVMRADPPKVGTIVTYRYQETTQAGIPRFPTFVGIAIDKEWPQS